MKILLDECLPRKLKYELPTHEVWTVPERGWAGTKNGTLLSLATADDFELFITVDQGLSYQQNLSAATLAIVLLVAADNRFDTLQPLMVEVEQTLPSIQPGQIIRVGSP